jgi:hypothetical protein
MSPLPLVVFWRSQLYFLNDMDCNTNNNYGSTLPLLN